MDIAETDETLKNGGDIFLSQIAKDGMHHTAT
jgi:hypothetical protein